MKPYSEHEYTLKSLKPFTHFGSSVNAFPTLENELSPRYAKPSASFGRFRHRLWKDRDIKLNTKRRVYHSFVILILFLYRFETWALYREQESMLDTFHMRCRLLNYHFE